MNLTYFDVKETSHLVEEFYHISYTKEETPLKTTMIPYGVSGLTYIFGKGQKTLNNNVETKLENLVINGQFTNSYDFIVDEPGFSFGINFKPTTLHKITNADLSMFTNKNSSFKILNEQLSTNLEKIFLTYKENKNLLFSKLEELLLTLKLAKNKKIEIVDETIEMIKEEQGLLSVNDLLKKVPFSQKTLENNFKKMVGLTPSKYIRIQRFLNLMKKYENNTIDFKDLIYMYNYYDESHFAKDFKSFTSKLPKDYFTEDFSIMKEAFKK